MASCAGCHKEKDAAATPEGPTKEWLEGILPASVNAGTPVSGGTLTVRLVADPPMLNRLHDAGQDAWLLRITHGTVVETLCELDRETAPAYRMKPLLAESYEISPDGLTSTFRLRHGVTFHDGQSFSAKDVKAMLDAVMDRKNPTTRMRALLTDLDTYATPDDYTVVLKWTRPNHLGTRNFATLLPIFPASALKGSSFDELAIQRAPIGTGPFKFQSWETGKAITLVRNEAYWGRKAYLDRIVFRVVKDDSVATQMFERGEFDLMTAIQPTVWRELEKPEAKNAWAWRDYHRIRFTENAYDWIGWNEEKPFFKSKEVRRALAHLIPMERLEKAVYLGLEPATTCPFYSRSAYCDPALEAEASPQRIRYDVEKARALLRGQGWIDSDGDGVLDQNGVPFRITFLIYAHSVNLGKLAPILQEEFRKVGIEMEIERVDWAAFTDRLRRHDFDMTSLGWSTMDVEDDLFFNFHSSQRDGGTNYVSYASPTIDALVEQSRREYDEKRRIEINRQIHRTIYDDQVYTFLGVRSTLDAVKKTVHGIRPALNWYKLSDVWIEAP